MDNSKVHDMSFEEANAAFDRIAAHWLALEESFEVNRDNIKADILTMDKVETAIIRENIFSENEGLEEIGEEYLKFLFLPYVRAKLYFNSNDDRMRSIEVAKKLFLSYLGLCEHYELLPAVIKPILEKLNKENYKPSREEKVQMYRASKIAEDEATNLDAKWKQGSKNKRDAFKSLMIFKCFGAETDVEMIPQEMEMLKFRNKLETDTEFKKQYDAEMAKPRPKPYFYKLDDTKGNIPDPNDPKNQVRTADLKAQGGPHGHICGPCAKTKLDVMDTLWQPDHAQPNMTMEEHADLEMKLMHEKMEREKAHQAAEDEKMNRLTEHEKDDLQTLKDRAWDDWKDANEKGAGNKKR